MAALPRLDGITNGTGSSSESNPVTNSLFYAALPKTHEAIHAQYQPEPGLETELAERICLLLWRLRRFPLIENGIVAQSEPRVHLSYTEQVDENRRRIVQAEAGDREIKRQRESAKQPIEQHGAEPEPPQDKQPSYDEIYQTEVIERLTQFREEYPGAFELAGIYQEFAPLAAYETQTEKQLARAVDLLEKVQTRRRAKQKQETKERKGPEGDVRPVRKIA